MVVLLSSTAKAGLSRNLASNNFISEFLDLAVCFLSLTVILASFSSPLEKGRSTIVARTLKLVWTIAIPSWLADCSRNPKCTNALIP